VNRIGSVISQRKRAHPTGWALFLLGSLALTYFRAVYLALSSALPRFTVLFGMGRRGSRALWAPDIACRLVDSDNEANSKKQVEIAFKRDLGISQGYRVKPHGQLVPVS
jgi:hypothetical protein